MQADRLTFQTNRVYLSTPLANTELSEDFVPDQKSSLWSDWPGSLNVVDLGLSK
jgi:hypothetical protein